MGPIKQFFLSSSAVQTATQLLREHSGKVVSTSVLFGLVVTTAYLYYPRRNTIVTSLTTTSDDLTTEQKALSVVRHLSFSYARPNPLEMAALAYDVYGAVKFNRLSLPTLIPGEVEGNLKLHHEALKDNRLNTEGSTAAELTFGKEIVRSEVITRHEKPTPPRSCKWQRLDFYYDPKTGYTGVVYKKGHYIVVVHRGSSAFIKDWLLMDFTVIAENKHGGQLEPAYDFVKKVYQKILNGEENYRNCSLTMAGHSLGGWLANMIAFYFDYDLGVIIPSVAFDPPGAGKAMAKKRFKNVKEEGLNILNIFLTPNIVNGLGRPVGTCLQIVNPEGQSALSTSNFFGISHPMAEFIKHMGKDNIIYTLLEDWPSHGIKPLSLIMQFPLVCLVAYYLQSLPKTMQYRVFGGILPFALSVILLIMRLNQPKNTHGDGLAHLISDSLSSVRIPERCVHIRQLDNFLRQVLFPGNADTINEEFVAFAMQRARQSQMQQLTEQSSSEPNLAKYLELGTKPKLLFCGTGIISLSDGEEVRPILNELSKYAIPYILKSSFSKEGSWWRLSYPYSLTGDKRELAHTLKLFDYYQNISVKWNMAVHYVYALVDHINFIDSENIKEVTTQIGTFLTNLQERCFYVRYKDSISNSADNISKLLDGFLISIAEYLDGKVSPDFLLGLYTEAMIAAKEGPRKEAYFKYARICAAYLESLDTLNGWRAKAAPDSDTIATMIAELKEAAAQKATTYASVDSESPLPKPFATRMVKVFDPILYIRFFNAYATSDNERMESAEFEMKKKYFNYALALCAGILTEYVDVNTRLLPTADFKKWLDAVREQARCYGNFATHYRKYARTITDDEEKHSANQKNEELLYTTLRIKFAMIAAIEAHHDMDELIRELYEVKSSVFNTLENLACLKRDTGRFDDASIIFDQLLDNVRYLATPEAVEQQIRYDFVVNLQNELDGLFAAEKSDIPQAKIDKVQQLFGSLNKAYKPLDYNSLTIKQAELMTKLKSSKDSQGSARALSAQLEGVRASAATIMPA